MTAGVLTVGRKLYASGLYWENSPSGRVSQAAKEVARQPGNDYDFYATRMGDKKGRVPQFGLAKSDDGIKSGVPSLAACLANQQPGSWIGAFTFNEGTAVVIIRDDLILPEGDLFFEDESEARDHLYQEMAIGGFQRIFAPEAWGIPGADTMPITLLLNEKTDVRLRRVVMSKNTKLAIFGGLGCLLVILGIGWFMQAQRAEKEQRRVEQMATIQRMREAAAKLIPLHTEPKYSPPERKWEKQPNPLDIISGCQKALKEVPIGVAGWRIVGMSCSRSALSIRWARSHGYAKPPEGAVVNDSVSSAVSSVRLSGLKIRNPEDLLDIDVITKRYLAQNWPGSLRRAPDDPLPPPPPGQDPKKWNPPSPPWVKRSFTFNIPVLPWILPEFFTDLPGVTITSMKLVGNAVGTNNKWTIKGVIYENRR